MGTVIRSRFRDCFVAGMGQTPIFERTSRRHDQSRTTPTNKIKIKDGIQVCVIVKDLREAMDRYHSLFGIGPFEVYTVDTKELPGVTYRGQPGDYRVTVGMGKIGTGVLELLECERGETIYKEFLDKHGEGVHHIGFFVDQDHDRACNTLIDEGFPHTQGGPILGENRDGRFDYFDTERSSARPSNFLTSPKCSASAPTCIRNSVHHFANTVTEGGQLRRR